MSDEPTAAGAIVPDVESFFVGVTPSRNGVMIGLEGEQNAVMQMSKTMALNLAQALLTSANAIDGGAE